jgi:hypothetical protein
MKLEKFPVIAPDGTEYRVTITEEYDSLFGKYYEATVYVERINHRFFRFSRVHSRSYSFDSDDFVTMARQVVDEVVRDRAEKEALFNAKASGVEAFRQWDGKITNNTKPMEVSE